MKKLTRILPVLFAAGLVLTTCTKDENIVSNDVQDQINYELGALLLPVEEYAAIPVAPTPEIDFRLKVLTLLNVPPVGNQGGEGSCVAWGTTYAGRSIDWEFDHDASWSQSVNIFSPEYVYNQIKVSTCASGAYTISGLNLLKNEGVCTWTSMPYTDASCDLQPNPTQEAEAANYKIAGYATVPITKDAIQAHLLSGKPVIVAGPVDRAFMKLLSGAVLTKRKGSLGGHCYCVVGYDDAKSAFKFINSWGPNWASAGFGWIHYNYLTQWWQEAYVIN